ncbi:MAG: site-specific DNA-methyltransferase [Candidatus Handelsmanbacteria bacterium]|nr:site-specific DNA-methyltransferase [Candidatus Handelsmanbacteria bacterium]
MQTTHQVFFGDARRLDHLADGSADLIVTSPPYPMIEMWDAAFAHLNPTIAGALEHGDGGRAFELMHMELDQVWRECFRVLRPGGLACINIGDTVRNIGDDFRMYSNHARLIQVMLATGFVQLPDILWRKPTNAPNKFMGSGMLPAGAYVTYEHEYILIFRKGEKRVFNTLEEKRLRRESAYFWEERNRWFSDMWTDLKGTGQGLADRAGRDRSAAYPFELAYRLLCMHSVYGDRVLDPFLGTGTTMAAAIASGRHSVGVESDEDLGGVIHETMNQALRLGRQRAAARLAAHREFVAARCAEGKEMKHRNTTYGFPVVTAQETDLVLYAPESPKRISSGNFTVNYAIASD